MFFFLIQNDPSTLKNVSYKDDQLPSMNENVPQVVQKLVENMLHRNPNEVRTTRIYTADIAGAVNARVFSKAMLRLTGLIPDRY